MDLTRKGVETAEVREDGGSSMTDVWGRLSSGDDSGQRAEVHSGSGKTISYEKNVFYKTLCSINTGRRKRKTQKGLTPGPCTACRRGFWTNNNLQARSGLLLFQNPATRRILD